MRVRIQTRVWFVTGVAVAAVVLYSIVAVWGLERHRAVQRWVEHSMEVLNVAQMAHGSLLGAESAIRGYILTEDAWLLNQYDAERTNVLASMGILKVLVSDNDEQRTTLAALETVIVEKLSFMAEQRRAFRSGGMAAALNVTRQGDGRTLMRQANDLFGAFKGTERRLLRERQAAEIAVVDEVRLVGIASALLLVALLLVTTVLTSRALASPIRMLVDRIAAYAAGERRHAMRVTTNTEIDQIGEALHELAQRLEQEEERRRATDLDLRAANESLRERTRELTEQTRIVTGLARMAEQLQGALTREEIGAIVVRHGKALMDDTGGSLLLLNPSRNELVELASWNLEGPRANHIGPNECWGLRQGRAHLVHASEANVACPHLAAQRHPWSLCVPLVAQGEVLGLLTVTPAAPAAGENGDPDAEARTAAGPNMPLVTALAEQIALAVAKQGLAETLRNQSIRDPLTELFNRRFMEESLDREIARSARLRVPVSVIMLDVDHFKRFNENYGHDAGDAVLKAMGRLMKRSVRTSDIACRYGGEEFLIILPDASLDEAMQRAEYLRSAVKDTAVVQGGRRLERISISLGVATYPDHAVDRDSLVTTADDALRRAKAEGRDRVVSAATLRAA